MRRDCDAASAGEVEKLKKRAAYALWWLEDKALCVSIDARVIHAKRALVGEVDPAVWSSSLVGDRTTTRHAEKGGPMRFEHGGTDWRIRFQHTRPVKLLHERVPVYLFPEHLKRVTRCFVETWRQIGGGGPNQVEDWETMATAEAVCSRQDAFVKEQGRRIALRRCVEDIADPALKARIWDAYLTRATTVTRP